MHLDQRRILITGGGSGIGLALARAVAPNNQVVIAGRDMQKLERASAELAGLHALALDVTSEDEAQRAVTWIEGHFGGLDLLINSAGVLRDEPFESPQAESATTEQFAINILGSARMTRVALPLLRRSEDGASLSSPPRLRWARRPAWPSTRRRKPPFTPWPARFARSFTER